MNDNHAISSAGLEATSEELRSVFANNAERYDREAVFPAANFEALVSSGLHAVAVPRRYGGQGLTYAAYGDFLATLAKGCASTASAFHMHNSVMWFLDVMGTDEQKEHYYPKALSGALFGSWGAEPSTSWAGRIALNTGFVQADDGVAVTGSKYFCSLGEGASFGMLYAVAGERVQQANIEDVQFLIVDARGPGIRIEDQWDTLGMRATVSKPVILEKCPVPSIGILGEPGAIRSLPTEIYAYGYASVLQGVAEAALEYAIEFANSRKVRPADIPISHFDRTQRKIGEASLAVHMSGLAVREAGRRLDTIPRTDRAPRVQACLMARAASARASMSVTSWAIEVTGGPGAIKGNPLERAFRDARTGALMVPAVDQCLETVAKSALGLDSAVLS